MQPATILSLLALVGSGLCDWPAPGTVAHDSLNPVVDTLGPNGSVIKKFLPLLHIAHGSDGKVVGGHRHDWETSIVWFDSASVNSAIITGGACSGHGKFKLTSSPQINSNNVKVEYYTQGGLDHELQFTNTVGRTYWIWDWDAMEPIVKGALNKGDFKKANCPFNDNHFETNMRAAYV
ncbi:necrosis- and ethylene-inducing protein and ethylene inducing peptide [Colletotrichum salicis]|uniref:Necrosis-and ethylene-inducing protein and ethylene inducing peptide n=1 Tax=Colletotrichum salicis TaxID=1209931 RepID=A0A135U111_9PEZI|nr:necrosis- and ethylene-inducing protein and ethylene inducing peptide [Colletotrichum salicis]